MDKMELLETLRQGVKEVFVKDGGLWCKCEVMLRPCDLTTVGSKWEGSANDYCRSEMDSFFRSQGTEKLDSPEALSVLCDALVRSERISMAVDRIFGRSEKEMEPGARVRSSVPEIDEELDYQAELERAIEENEKEIKAMNVLLCIYKLVKPWADANDMGDEEKELVEEVKKETPLDWGEILRLENGVRIANVLKNGDWDERFSFCFSGAGGDHYAVLTVEDLMKVDRIEFLRKRNAGKLSWESLERYIGELKVRTELGSPAKIGGEQGKGCGIYAAERNQEGRAIYGSERDKAAGQWAAGQKEGGA